MEEDLSIKTLSNGAQNKYLEKYFKKGGPSYVTKKQRKEDKEYEYLNDNLENTLR
jgi:hypothetical protein